MHTRNGAILVPILCALGLCGYAQPRAALADSGSESAQRARLVLMLSAAGTPESLASAALLSLSGAGRSRRESLGLIARAVALAPQRAELIWEQVRLCALFKCAAAKEIDARLQEIDPGNGFAWLSALQHAEEIDSASDITGAVERIGRATRLTIYWDELEVLLIDAMAVDASSGGGRGFNQTLTTRAEYASGILAAVVVPPLQPLALACRLEAFDEPGRRAACEVMVTHLERADTVITQSLALSIQEPWWPEGSAQHAAVNAKRRRLQYLVAMSGQPRPSSRDAAILIDAARHGEREQDAEISVLKARGIPVEPPPGWQDPLHPE